jgi:RNA polymerase sigma factor (sigma-70 family)
MKSPPDAAFTAMYGEHYAEVLRFVRRRAHPLTVDDVVSETFMAAWLRRSSLPSEPLPWLYRTARNVMLNSVRGAGRQQALAVRIASLTAVGADRGTDDVDHLERRLDLRSAFAQLHTADQEVLALDVWEDLDSRAASTVIGCTRATYSMRLTRARRRLAALLSAYDAHPLTHESLNGTKAHAY